MFTKGGGLSLVDLVMVVAVIASAVMYSDYRRLQDELAQEARALNNTPNGNQSAMIFNRNPKAASELVWSMLDR